MSTLKPNESKSDLEHFREEWRREIHHKDTDVDVDTQGKRSDQSEGVSKEAPRDIGRDSSAAGCGSASQAQHLPTQATDLETKAPSSSLADESCPLLGLSSSLTSGQSSQEHEKGQGEGTCQDGSDNNFSQELNPSDESEYYPFKILTRFLNEAPDLPKTVQGSGNKRRKLNAPTGMSYSRRKYFREEDNAQDPSKTKHNHPNKTLQKLEEKKDEGRILDLFIADLDEINEIPFFDSTVPREVAMKIFQHLDLKALCSCSLVSRSWHSLAEDEHLWFRMYQQLGYSENSSLADSGYWKMKVRQHIERERLLKANWKARFGKPYTLSFPKGGVLCAATSCGPNIAAGYTNCNVRMWNTETGDECTFNASNTALVIDEDAEELGTIQNQVLHLSSTARLTAASYRHGFVDLWLHERGTDPVHTISFNRPNVSSLCAQDVDSSNTVLAASQGHRVNVVRVGQEESHQVEDFDMSSPVASLYWLQHPSPRHPPLLLLSCQSSVWLRDVRDSLYRDSQRASTLAAGKGHSGQSMTEVHNIIWAPVTCVGLRQTAGEIGVGFNLHSGPSTQIKVNVYDVSTNRLQSQLTGHTWLVTCMHMPDCLPNQMATGSGDRKVRLYDLRAGTFPVGTLLGHPASVTRVQMDDWKLVSGDQAGFVFVWDQRMNRKLWDLHNRHPVQYCHFQDRLLIISNVPYQKFEEEDYDSMSSLRYRGTVQVYDFLADQQTQGLPDVCLSTYSEPEAFDYNLGLAVPYDAI